MAITLAQAKVGMKNKVAAELVEVFRNETVLFDLIPFDNAVCPTGKGSTLAYGYVCETLPAVAQSRSINEEYAGDQAVKEEVTVNLKILGNKYSIDRVIAETGGDAFMDEVAFQSKAIAKGVVNRFLYLFINGNATSDAEQFDGLAKLLGTNNNVSQALSTLTGAMTEGDAELICEALDTAESKLIRKPDAIIADDATINRIKAAARKSGYYKAERDEFGRKVEYYDDVPLIKAGKYYTKSGSTVTETANVAVAVYSDSSKTDTYIEDSSIAMSYMLLAAADQGLGGVWLQLRLRPSNQEGVSAEEFVNSKLNAPENMKVEALLVLGHVDEQPEAKAMPVFPCDKVHKEQW